ncbi:hypothetical protein FQA39_LY10607 [Lamprigera yunnana]|nr:hypothetical protein FQA39_LY10607 [Lamprigera yunnana]
MVGQDGLNDAGNRPGSRHKMHGYSFNTMNGARREEEVTVQGVESPVPARGELGAGSPGSITGHCTVIEAGDQAFPQRTSTRTETSTLGTSRGNTPFEWDEVYPYIEYDKRKHRVSSRIWSILGAMRQGLQ